MNKYYFLDKDIDNVKINNFISDDLETLQKHYTILLEYVKQLENNNLRLNETITRLNRKMEFYKNEREMDGKHNL